VIVEYRDGFGIALNYADKSFTMELPASARILSGTKEINPGGVLVWKE
jgi:beta-galactosidase